MKVRSQRQGFTLVELLVVITILGILVALLVPVIFSAIGTANNARVTGEINIFGQALASFSAKYGDYPPSRILLPEHGGLESSGPSLPYAGAGSHATAAGDIGHGGLAARSLLYLRKFFGKARFDTGSNAGGAGRPSYDFNGDGVSQNDLILLEGHEALVFFLGGIPQRDGSAIIGMSGFSKNPANPFQAASLLSTTGQAREAPFHDFRVDRLVDDDGDGMPGYVDTLGSGDTNRYLAYFSSYGGKGYDPNDINFNGAPLGEPPVNGQPSPFSRFFTLTFPMAGGTGALSTNLRVTASPLPNPYTSGKPVPDNVAAAATMINAQTYQIISAGRDRHYGVGGAYDASSVNLKLVSDSAIVPGVNGGNPVPLSDADRVAERDNLTNFTQGPLE